MLLIDANAILRYMLNDNTVMANQVSELVDSTTVTIRYEVVAEVVYVLEKVYLLPRSEIAKGINIFMSLPNVETEAGEALSLALKTYANQNLDFVDSVLYGLKAIYGYDVFTFDKRLKSIIGKLS